MASVSERSRNNIRAGIFVSAALILSLLVVIALTDAVNSLRRVTDNYVVTFDISAGVANLKAGSDVRVGGMKMGRVLNVTPQEPAAGEPLRTIAVKFNLDRAVALRSDVKILVVAPLIGADAWLEIPDVGNDQPLPPNSVIAGTSGPGMLTSLVGAGNAEKAGEFFDLLPRIKSDYSDKVRPILDNIKDTTDSAKTLVADLRDARWPKWAAQVDHLMDWAVAFGDKLNTAADDGQAILSQGRAMVEENRDDIRQSIANVKDITDTAKNETMAKINKVLDTGQQGLDEAVAAIRTLRTDYAQWATNLDEVMANASLTSQQLKLASIEIRRSPWKVLYAPSNEELQHELLYEATRSFALATADLKSTSETVRRILSEHGDKVAANEELFRRMEKSIQDSLAHYENAQQKMLDVLVNDSKK